jgi:hypothetical protein
MKENRLEKKPACSVTTAPVPGEVTCPHCGLEIEIWSDETEASCKLCGFLVSNITRFNH